MNIFEIEKKYELFFPNGEKCVFTSEAAAQICEVIINNLVAKVNRVEVIDKNGRSYVNWNAENKIELHFQDEDKTLKIFIKK